MLKNTIPLLSTQLFCEFVTFGLEHSALSERESNALRLLLFLTFKFCFVNELFLVLGVAIDSSELL